MKPIVFPGICAVFALLSAACGDGTTAAPVPASLAPVSVLAQGAVAGRPVPVRPAVSVSDNRGRGLPGVLVTFAVTAGDGFVTDSSRTDMAGVAVADEWVMGMVAQENTLAARVPGLPPVVFHATAGPGLPAFTQKAGGDERSGTVATALPDSLVVRVVDQYENGVPGIVVNFGATGGTLSATRVVTGAQGHARVGLVLPTQAGPLQVVAYVPYLERQYFYITARPAAPAGFTRVGGDGQTAYGGAAVVVAPGVRVHDAFGNPVPGLPVVFTPAPGSGAVTGGPIVTDGYGVARVGSWVLGEPGPNRLAAKAAGFDSLVFAATALQPCGSRPYPLFTHMEEALLRDPCTAHLRNARLYSFVVPSEQCLDLWMTSSAFDTYLFLLDGAGTVLAADDDSGGAYNSLIRRRLPAGTYLLGAAAFTGASSGTFYLSTFAVGSGQPCTPIPPSQPAASKQTR